MTARPAALRPGQGVSHDTSGRNGVLYTIDQNGKVLLLVAMGLRGPVHVVRGF